MKRYVLQDFGEDVQKVIDKVQALVELCGEDAILLSAADKEKLDSLSVLYATTEYWESQREFIPERGQIVIYSDYRKVEIEEEMQDVPGIKVGSGNAYLSDLTFLGMSTEIELLNHVSDTVAHTTLAEKKFWNNKLNINDNKEVEDETLIFNRN